MPKTTYIVTLTEDQWFLLLNCVGSYRNHIGADASAFPDSRYFKEKELRLNELHHVVLIESKQKKES